MSKTKVGQSSTCVKMLTHTSPHSSMNLEFSACGDDLCTPRATFCASCHTRDLSITWAACRGACISICPSPSFAARPCVIRDCMCRRARFDAIQTKTALYFVLTCNRHTFQASHSFHASTLALVTCCSDKMGKKRENVLSVCFWSRHFTAEA